MIQLRGSGARFALVLLCVFAARATAAQQPQPAPEKGTNKLTGFVGPSQAKKMPNVLWLDSQEATSIIRRQLDRGVKIGGRGRIVLNQDPLPDAPVSADGPIVLTVGVPKLVFTSKPNPRVGEVVAFEVAFEPPPVNAPAINYHFVWDDGGGDETTAEPRTTHQFKEAGLHNVTAYALLNKQMEFAERATMRIDVVPPPPPSTAKMPQLLWLERSEAETLLAPLKVSANIDGQDGIVVAQSVPAGLDVAPGSAVTLTLALPKLTLSATTLNPAANDEVAFNLTFDSPPPAPPTVAYRFQWGDGTEEPPTEKPAATHRFSPDRNDYMVSAVAVIGNRTVESNTLTLLLRPSSKVMPQLLWLEKDEAKAQLRALKLGAKFDGQDGIVLEQNPPAGSDIQPGSPVGLKLGLPRLTLSASTREVRVNDVVTFNAAFDPPPPPSATPKITYRISRDGTPDTAIDQTVATHQFTNRGTYIVVASAVINDRWSVESAPVSLSVVAPSPKIPWLLILLGAAALSVAAYLVRQWVKRQQGVPLEAASFRTGPGSISHTIEHAEQIRNGLSVRLRGGIRSAAAAEGGADG